MIEYTILDVTGDYSILSILSPRNGFEKKLSRQSGAMKGLIPNAYLYHEVMGQSEADFGGNNAGNDLPWTPS